MLGSLLGYVWNGDSLMKGIGMKKFSGISVAVAVLAAATLAGCPPVQTVDNNSQDFAAGGAATSLAGKQLYYMPDGSVSFYSRTVQDITALPVDAAAHTVVDFTVADPSAVNLAAPGVSFYGVDYQTLWIGSDGTVSFGAPGAGNGNLTDHFTSTQISLLPVDATVAGSTVSVDVAANAVTITFVVGGDSIQLELFTAGGVADDIAVAYPALGADAGGVVGMANGQLAGANAAQQDAFFEEFGTGSDLATNNTAS
jgi:hypothetical protein